VATDPRPAAHQGRYALCEGALAAVPVERTGSAPMEAVPVAGRGQRAADGGER
jgi:hypothetical protein